MITEQERQDYNAFQAAFGPIHSNTLNLLRGMPEDCEDAQDRWIRALTRQYDANIEEYEEHKKTYNVLIKLSQLQVLCEEDFLLIEKALEQSKQKQFCA